MKKLLFLILCFAGMHLHGNDPFIISQEISDYILKEEYKKIKEIIYYFSNETKPALALPFFKQLPQGTSYVTLGNADRGYINAALSDAELLIFFDNHPGIVIFNIINTLLIRASDTMDEYRTFRKKIGTAIHTIRDGIILEDTTISKDSFLQACTLFWDFIHTLYEQKFDLLLSPVGQSRYCSEPDSPTLSDFEYTYAGGFTSLLCPAGPEHPFENANFLYDKELFNKVKKLAQDVIIIQADLTNPADLKNLKTMIKNQQIKVGIIDISNVFPIDYFCKSTADPHTQYRKHKKDRFYITKEEFVKFLMQIKEICHKEAKILSTEWSSVVQTKKVVSPNGNILDLPRLAWMYKFGALKDVLNKKCVIQIIEDGVSNQPFGKIFDKESSHLQL